MSYSVKLGTGNPLLGQLAIGRYKRRRMVQYFNTQFPSLLEYKSSEIFKMFDVNATRLPIFTELIYLSYVGDDVSRTLTRGER